MIVESTKLTFRDVPGRDVYNITAPFIWQGRTVIAGRVERRDEELSEICLFEQAGDGQGEFGVGSDWKLIKSAPSFPGLQDPCVTTIGGKLLLGGVRFPVTIGTDQNAWQMEFYLESSQGEFGLTYTGPKKMKDIRFIELPDTRIVVFTRPQGEIGGRGKIGYVIVDSLDQISDDLIENAPLFDQCPPEQWVGANEAHVLSDGTIGVLGHIASFSEKGDRHYYAMVFNFDPATGLASKPEVIGRRSDFPEGVSKRPDLVDVIFSGGLHRCEGCAARLFAGLSDAEAGYLEIPDPFIQYENE